MRLNKSPVRAGYQAVTGFYWVGSLLNPPFFAHTGFVVAIFIYANKHYLIFSGD